jgi:hypothetical protein
MASARYWRINGLEAWAGGDLEVFAWNWYDGSNRVDAAATVTSSHAPIAGSLSDLQGTSTSARCRFAASAVRSGGFYILWDFGAAVTDITPRIGAAGLAEFVAYGRLQYSTDGVTWFTDVNFGRVLYPGLEQFTPSDPILRYEPTSNWDSASTGSAVTISGRKATVWSDPSGYVRTDIAKTNGRRVFGLRLDAITAPQVFFGGMAALSGWGAFTGGKHWIEYGYDDNLYYYPDGTAISVSGQPGAPQAAGDIMYFDVNLDDGTMALRKNSSAWSSRVSLPNFVVGADYVIDMQAPSSSTSSWSATLLTTTQELAGVVPSGASAWDIQAGTNIFHDPTDSRGSSPSRAMIVSSAPVDPVRIAAPNRVRMARDMEFGGIGTIYGTTKIKGTPNTPTKARVRLLRDRDGLLARETWSDPATGAYSFTGIDTAQMFTVLAQDLNGAFRPVAASQLKPEEQP